jgi:DNA-binding XRE family transcriptional regulator
MMKKPIKKKKLSTYEEMILNSKVKKDLDTGYKELVISELVLALMQEDHVSVRMLAKEAGLSPTTIQELKTKNKLPNMKTFFKIMDHFNLRVTIQKENGQIMAVI